MHPHPLAARIYGNGTQRRQAPTGTRRCGSSERCHTGARRPFVCVAVPYPVGPAMNGWAHRGGYPCGAPGASLRRAGRGRIVAHPIRVRDRRVRIGRPFGAAQRHQVAVTAGLHRLCHGRGPCLAALGDKLNAGRRLPRENRARRPSTAHARYLRRGTPGTGDRAPATGHRAAGGAPLHGCGASEYWAPAAPGSSKRGAVPSGFAVVTGAASVAACRRRRGGRSSRLASAGSPRSSTPACRPPGTGPGWRRIRALLRRQRLAALRGGW